VLAGRCTDLKSKLVSMKIRAEKDFWSGVLFIVFAIVAILTARNYSLGTVGRMGPGYFPIALGVLLAGLGLFTIAKSFVADGEQMESLNLGAIFGVVFAVVGFALTIERLGLVVAIAVVTSILSLAFRQLGWIGFVSLTAGLIVFSLIVFVYALQLPLTVWPAL
jgi:putative Mn2+ efflux pump MntP